MIVVPAGVKCSGVRLPTMRKGLDGLAMLCVVRSWAAFRKALSQRVWLAAPLAVN